MKLLDLRAAPQCIVQLAPWHHAEWTHLYPRETLADFTAELQQSLGPGPVPTTFVALRDGQLLGSASLLAADMHTHPELGPWLASVFVAPACRGRGVGSALILRVMEAARAAGFARLYLFTPDRAALYARLGWTERAREPYEGVMVTLMELRPQGIAGPDETACGQ